MEAYIEFFRDPQNWIIVQTFIQIFALLGIIAAAQQARIAKKTFKFNYTPLLLHTGFFNFFADDNRPEKLSVATIKNAGERTCFNIQGWCLISDELFQLVLGEAQQLEDHAEFIGDFKYVWASKNHEFRIALMRPSRKVLSGINDHLLLLYEDAEGIRYYSYLDKKFKYKTGVFTIKKFGDETGFSEKVIKDMLGLI